MAQGTNPDSQFKKKSILFTAVFIICMIFLSGFMYFVPKFRQLFFDVPQLRPSAEELLPAAGNVFADVEGIHENALAITYLKSKGVIKGYEDGTFRPEELITRGEVMKLVVQALHIYPHHVSYRYCYEDVGDEWFAPYVCYARQREWIAEGDEGRFYPERNITGAEFLKIVIHAYKVQGLEEETSDTPGPWYEPYVNLAEQKGWLSYFMQTDGFDPQASLTRGELSELLFSIMQTEKFA